MNRTNVDKNKRVLVALSGGVDSSVAAALLLRQLAEGQVEGAYMRCWSEGPYCTADADQADAAKVAATLGIPFHVFDFEKEYKDSVIDYFYSEYEAGRTPNPDVMCNKEIKFGIFLRKALELGFDYIATGHYARVENGNGYHLLTGRDANKDSILHRSKHKVSQYSRMLRPLRGLQNRNSGYQLLTGMDKEKDQSYFLYLLNQEALVHTIFPLGDLTKQKVRKLAKKFRLPTAEKPDSTGICFVGPARIKDFLLQKIKTKHGDIVNLDDKVLGKHIGLPFYTIGQREGLRISAPVPYYVAGKNIKENKLIVAPFGHVSLFKDRFTTQAPHWVAGVQPRLPKKVWVKLRYRAENTAAVINKVGAEKLEIVLEAPQRAITPGQAVVFYDGEKILGGAAVRDSL